MSPGREVFLFAGLVDAVAGLLAGDAEFLGDLREGVADAVLAECDVALRDRDQLFET